MGPRVLRVFHRGRGAFYRGPKAQALKKHRGYKWEVFTAEVRRGRPAQDRVVVIGNILA